MVRSLACILPSSGWIVMYRGVHCMDGKIVYGAEVIDQFKGMPGTWLVTKNDSGYEAAKVEPETIEEIEEH